HADLGIEGFHLPDNLMIIGAVHSCGYPVFLPTDGKTRGLDALDVFETCVEAAARYFAKRP
ncbi:MAG TPA: nucleoside 2-deoxyribosyltransferase, partial [Bradyrhizobium sp.]